MEFILFRFQIACVSEPLHDFAIALVRAAHEISEHPTLSDVGWNGLPSQRRRVVEELKTWNTAVSLAVSPVLPLENVEAFADWISNSVDYALVDTFLAGDGSSGVRTGRRSKTPEIFTANGWDWRNETQAKNLFRLLQDRMGNRVKWSQEGFICLAELQ